MKFSIILIIFLVINFGSLAIGSKLMGSGPQSEWYMSLNKAPWTPPGWVFGAAWTTIMICFSIYMAQLYTNDTSAIVISLFVAQVLLNVSWNFLFFNQQKVDLALISITLLTVLMLFFLVWFYGQMQLRSLLVLPYVVWLIIATSLNFYVYTNN